MKPEQFKKIRKYLPNKNRRTGAPGWYTAMALKLGMSEVWVQKAAKDQDGLHSDDLDREILRVAEETRMKKVKLLNRIRRVR